MNESYEQAPLESAIISFCLKTEAYDRVKNILDPSMFEGDWSPIWKTVVEAHAKHEGDITVTELRALFNTLNPALPSSTKERYSNNIDNLTDNCGTSADLQYEIIKKFWMRNRARIISELSVNIFLGKSNEFGELKRLIESSAEDSLGEKTTYTEVSDDFDELLDSLSLNPEFPFSDPWVARHVPGMDRGHFGIIFARPETGKTTFVSHLAKDYIKQGLQVAVWGNEEPAIRTKLRIIQSYYEITREEMHQRRPEIKEKVQEDISPYLTVLDSTGTSIQEIDDWCKINKPDVVFIDQMDKVRVDGKFNRGDEKLKEIYLQGREIAKRHHCLVWAVSQASAEGAGLVNLEYTYLDNSKTGKAGEADLIIGIGKSNDVNESNIERHLCISKNKQNGWHGTIHCSIDIARAVYNG